MVSIQNEGRSNTSKRDHYVFLDGLRGVAALAVGWLHATEIFSTVNQVPNAGLAVDFFFCLSGFVVAYAYDHKLATSLTIFEFLKTRLIRLWPMIFLGLTLGAGASILSLHSHGDFISNFIFTLVLYVASLFLIPLGLLFGEQAFFLNTPMWSLFFELLANLTYAAQRRFFARLNRFILAFTLGVSGILLLLFSYYRGGVEHLGHGAPMEFAMGVIRVGFPTMAGVLIFMSRAQIKAYRVPAYLIAIALAIILFAAPNVPPWIYQSIMVLIAFPIIIYFGLHTEVDHRTGRLWALLGKLSYPFYLIHVPVLRGIYHIPYLFHQNPKGLHWLPPLALIVTAVVSMAALKTFDEPARKYLADIINKK